MDEQRWGDWVVFGAAELCTDMTDRNTVPCESLLFAEIINSRSKVLFCRKKKQRKKNINFWLCALRKNGFRKKNRKKKYWHWGYN